MQRIEARRLVTALGLAALGGLAMAQAADLPPGFKAADEAGKATLAVVAHHAQAMGTMNVDTILADYADDAIVLTTLADQPLVGKEAIRKICAKVLKMPAFQVKDAQTKFLRSDGVGEYAYLVFESDVSGIHGSETYVVRGGKIVFESATIRFSKPKPSQAPRPST